MARIARGGLPAATRDLTRDPMTKKVPRVAVIAVHGVGHHEPRASAHAIAQLLLRTPRRAASPYTSFSEHCITIPARRVPEEMPPPPAAARTRGRVAERPAVDSEVPPAPLDVEFMRGQLNEYSPSTQDGVYETVRLEGHRIDGDGAKRSETDVHIYEMFWSDISEIGKSILGIFGAFYQLIIHLPYVGAWTLEQLPKPLSDSRPWKTLRTLYTGAQRSITLLAPTFNIVLLALSTSLLMRHVPEGSRPWAAKIVAALSVLAAAIWVMFRDGKRRRGWQILLPVLFAALALAFPARLLEKTADWVLIGEWWLLSSLPLYLVFSTFEKNRPFARTLGIVTYIAVTIGLVRYGLTRGDAGVAVLNVMEWVVRTIQWTWFLFGVCLACVIALGVILAERAGEERARARRAAYTSRFALALPAVAFSAATLLVWGGLVAAESATAFGKNKTYTPVFEYPALAAHQRYDSTRIDRLVAAESLSVDSVATKRQELHAPAYFLRAFWGSADTTFGLISTMLVGLILLIVVVVLVPVVLTEVRSPPSPPQPTDQDGFAKSSIRLGYWLSFAFRASRIAGELLGAVCLLWFLAFFVVEPSLHRLVPESWTWLTRSTENGLGLSFRNYGGWVASGAGAIGALALFGRLSRAGSGIRPVLGIAVDVDNYLRELPSARTPRARMAERYTSLLRYVCEWRANSDDPASGYDSIVIIAHSQGCIITVDLLRYLQYERSAKPNFESRLARLDAGAASPLPIALFTMGNPLRQLYALRFPHLYSWVGFETSAGPVLTNLLGVRSWLNAYRSGDYVGRAVWRDNDQDEATFKAFSVYEAPGVTEVCIGPGAHTHYWDESADIIATYLDDAIKT